MLQCQPSPKRTRPLTSLAVGSARRPKPLTTFAIGPSFVKSTLPQPLSWTRSAGPHVSRILTTRPTLPEFSLASPLFRAILLHRLRLPLPLTSARCRCHAHRRLPALRLFAGEGRPLERAAARVCREAGAAVERNVLVSELNVDPARQDDPRIEVIANGLPLSGGAQLAVDTTLVSPVTAAGLPRRAGGRTASLQNEPKSAHTLNCACITVQVQPLQAHSHCS